jgi:purine-binding chemotaxis protein CheW
MDARKIQATPGDGADQEFLTFRLGTEEYGIEILKVKEIRSKDVITAIATAPAFIKGVINLRGTIVPIVDLRIKFQLASAQYNEFTVVIILQLASQVMGIVVDSVSDVLALKGDQIKPAPEFGTAVATQYICGIGSIEERMLILMDIEKLLSMSELQSAHQHMLEAGSPCEPEVLAPA